MVAISLYRGNLHKVPDVPRRWLMPKHTITLKDFRSLTRRRDKTLSRLDQPSTSSNPNPNPNLEPKEETHPTTTTSETPPVAELQEEGNSNGSKEAASQQHLAVSTSGKDLKELNDDSLEEKPRGVDGFSPSDQIKLEVPESVCNGGGDKEALQKEVTVEISKNVELLKEKKRRELEEKLTILNGKKHNLVQMLKQILNAEEELKRRNNVQAPVARPPVPLQGEASVDFGSSPRPATRVGSDANCSGDLEGESEDASNHNTHTRHFHRMRSTSPSASSPLRKAAHNVVPYTTRTASPSRFAPTGSQGHPANLPPPVSLSGTQLIASSPSPAASGGTSVFRDTRLTSPSWN